MKIAELLAGLDEEIFTPELTEKVSTMFETAVSETVDQRVKLVVDNELAKLDEDHCQKVTALLEMVDEDHLKRTKEFIETMDESYTAKLAKVIKLNRNAVETQARELRENMTSTISTFLDVYLDEAFPHDVVKEACENTKARHLLEKIRNVVGLDDSYISDSIKGAVVEGYEQIQTLKEELKTALRESQEMALSLDKAQAALVLEQKTSGMPKEKREFFRRVLENKPLSDINENFSYVQSMYEKEEREIRESVATQTSSRVVSENLDRPAKVLPKVEDKPTKNSDVAFCLEAMKRS